MWNSMNGFHVKHWNLLILKNEIKPFLNLGLVDNVVTVLGPVLGQLHKVRLLHI